MADPCLRWILPPPTPKTKGTETLPAPEEPTPVRRCTGCRSMVRGSRDLHLQPEPQSKGSRFCQVWWARLDSNQGPIGYEPTALPLSYEPENVILSHPSPPRNTTLP